MFLLDCDDEDGKNYPQFLSTALLFLSRYAIVYKVLLKGSLPMRNKGKGCHGELKINPQMSCFTCKRK